MSNDASAAYLMGHTELERRRLEVQASILNPLTDRLLRDAGISTGMRILDLGCGVGDVALLAARISGPSGEVVGIDLDETVLAIARLRAAEQELRSVIFRRADAVEYSPDCLFDAVIGRHVLLHASDPLRIVRRAFSLLRPGGIAAFQEYDMSYWPTRHADVPITAGLQQALVELFRRATPHADIGMRLSDLLEQAGFSESQSSAECLVDCGPNSLFYEWFAETVRSVLPAMEKFGLASSAGDVNTLQQRLRDEMLSAGVCITSPRIVGAFGTKPARP